MHHHLRPVLHEGAVGSRLLTSSKIVLVVVLNKRPFCVNVPIAVGVDIGLRTLVLIVKNYIGVSVYTLDSDAETICTSSITMGLGGAGWWSEAPLWSAVRNASHSVRFHQECRRKITPSPWIRWRPSVSTDRLTKSEIRHYKVQYQQMYPSFTLKTQIKH